MTLGWVYVKKFKLQQKTKDIYPKSRKSLQCNDPQMPQINAHYQQPQVCMVLCTYEAYMGEMYRIRPAQSIADAPVGVILPFSEEPRPYFYTSRFPRGTTYFGNKQYFDPI